MSGHAATGMLASTTLAQTDNSPSRTPARPDCTHAVWNSLEACGWPGPRNTGPDMSQCPDGLEPAGTNAKSTIRITTPGETISCKKLIGGLQIAAQNVTVKNVMISYDGLGAGGTGVIKINEGASATIDHVEIDGLDRTHACIWNEGTKGDILTSSMVAKHVNCHDVNDGIFSWWSPKNAHSGAGSDFLIQDSYLHDFTVNAANGHIDGYQTEGASNGVIIHNTFRMERTRNDVDVPGGGVNSAIALWDSFNQSSPSGLTATNFEVVDNLIGGGGFAIYAEDYSPSEGGPEALGGNQLTNTFFRNNKFSIALAGRCVGTFGIWFHRPTWRPYQGGPSDGWHRSGNVILETGVNVDRGNPPGCQ